jgi:hypothetical protein
MSACVLSATTRQRLAMQGFIGLNDTALAAIGPWLRLAPAICSARESESVTIASRRGT